MPSQLHFANTQTEPQKLHTRAHATPVRKQRQLALAVLLVALGGLAALYPSPGAQAKTMLPHTVQTKQAPAIDYNRVLVLTGQVCEKSTGQPIPGAQVGVAGQRVTAGAGGVYTAMVQPATHLLVEASAEGHQTLGPIAIANPDGRLLKGRAQFSFCAGVALSSAFSSSDGSLQIAHFSQFVPATGQLAISGTSSVALEDNAAVELPNGQVTLLPLQHQGLSIRLTMPLAAGPGRYVLEINAAPGYALLKLPIYAGIRYTPPAAPPAYVADPPGANLATLAEKAIAGINLERAKAGQPAIQSNPRLAQEALAHSRDVATGGFIAQHGHVGSDGSSPAQRVQAAGVPFQEVAEDIGMGGSVQEILLGLMDSPAHRWAILGNFTAAGAGVARQGNALVLTVDFVR